MSICSSYSIHLFLVAQIETTQGDVFGAFCSHTWKTHPTFFGGAPAFLWRMRHNRRTPCHSLFDQAQMESEIDVYTYSGLNDLVQVCDERRLAIGGGKLTPDEADMSAGGGGRGDGGLGLSTKGRRVHCASGMLVTNNLLY